MKVFKLISTCPYYGNEETIGIYSTVEQLEQAKEIKARCSRIEDFEKRFSVDEVELDKMPWDCDNRIYNLEEDKQVLKEDVAELVDMLEEVQRRTDDRYLYDDIEKLIKKHKGD